MISPKLVTLYHWSHNVLHSEYESEPFKKQNYQGFGSLGIGQNLETIFPSRKAKSLTYGISLVKSCACTLVRCTQYASSFYYIIKILAYLKCKNLVRKMDQCERGLLIVLLFKRESHLNRDRDV